MNKKLTLGIIAIVAAASAFAFGAPKEAHASCGYVALAQGLSDTDVDGQVVADYFIAYGGEASGCANYQQIFYYSRFATSNGLRLDTGSGDSAYAYITDTSIATDAPKYYKTWAGKWNGYSGCDVNHFCTSGQFSSPWYSESSNFVNGDNEDDLYQFAYPSQVEDSNLTHFNLAEATEYDCLIC